MGDGLTARIKDFRDKAASGDATPGLLISGFVNREVETRARLLQEALPNRFARKSAGLTGASNLTLTPVQATLLAYSVISDDYLLDSEANLRKYMKQVREFRAKRAPGFPGPAGHFAYGSNGYLHSAPLDIFMDEQTTHRMLRLVEERSAR